MITDIYPATGVKCPFLSYLASANHISIRPSTNTAYNLLKNV